MDRTDDFAGLAYGGCRPAPLFSFSRSVQMHNFSFSPKGAGLFFPAKQGYQRSGTERAASPGNGADKGVWGATPTSRERDFWRQRRKSLSSICGNKCTACQVAQLRWQTSVQITFFLLLHQCRVAEQLLSGRNPQFIVDVFIVVF